MVSQPDPERLYTDEEVAAILRRAVQPRSRASANLPTRTREGINLATLEQIATETGIDPARVREAALSLEADSESEGGSILFGPRSSHVFDRVIEGEVPRERLSDLVAAMRRLTRVKGKVVEVGDWLEWTSDASSIHVTVKPENGQTRLQLMGDAGFRLLGIWGPLTLATFIAIVATGERRSPDRGARRYHSRLGVRDREGRLGDCGAEGGRQVRSPRRSTHPRGGEAGAAYGHRG
jgi:hypothetical protein